MSYLCDQLELNSFGDILRNNVGLIYKLSPRGHEIWTLTH